jgi:hypothetical protein
LQYPLASSWADAEGRRIRRLVMAEIESFILCGRDRDGSEEVK